MVGIPFKPGERPPCGRAPGTQNKITRQIKTAIMAAFEEAGGVDYLVAVAKDDPRTFCALLGKLLPQEIKGDLEVIGLAALLAAARARRGIDASVEN